MKTHITEKVSELGNAELNFRTQAGGIARTGSNLVIFITNGGEWLEVSISKKNMSTLSPYV